MTVYSAVLCAFLVSTQASAQAGGVCGDHGDTSCTKSWSGWVWMGLASDTGDCGLLAKSKNSKSYFVSPLYGMCGLLFDDEQQCLAAGLNKPGFTCASVGNNAACNPWMTTCSVKPESTTTTTTTTTTTVKDECGTHGKRNCDIAIEYQWLGPADKTGDCGVFAKTKGVSRYWVLTIPGNGCGLLFDSLKQCVDLGLDGMYDTRCRQTKLPSGCALGQTCELKQPICGPRGKPNCDLKYSHGWITGGSPSECADLAVSNKVSSFFVSTKRPGVCGLVFNSRQQCLDLGLDKTGAPCWSVTTPNKGCTDAEKSSDVFVTCDLSLV